MSLDKQQLWQRYQQRCVAFPSLGLAMDFSRVDFPEDYYATMAPLAQRAFEAMERLVKGDKANPDEKDEKGEMGRMVGHYWLRNSSLAPTDEIRRAIDDTVDKAEAFARRAHRGEIKGAGGKKFKNLLVIGIGGSALGPQFVANALGGLRRDKMDVFFFDNTDPDGMDKALARIGKKLDQTLCVVISKSGGTPETRNGMIEAARAYREAGLRFEDHAVAITMAGSKLDQIATDDRWLERFPMWDWVGGRTSETSVVGLLPAALQGLDIRGLLKGARACDEVTSKPEIAKNPAMQLALMWHFIGRGRGEKDMVVLPYKDRLELFSRYLQQLIMESLGKERDLDNQLVNQGIAVYGNKGSTDQHAYIQQLRDGLDNFFVTFIEVLRDRKGPSVEVVKDSGITSGDFLSGFLLGTRQALYEKGRQSVTLTLDEVSPFSVGVLIALFERAVGFYASLVNINAYHQPGVQAGKEAADEVLKLQLAALKLLSAQPGVGLTAEEMAAQLGKPAEAETLYKVCQRLAANPGRSLTRRGGKTPATATFVWQGAAPQPEQ